VDWKLRADLLKSPREKEGVVWVVFDEKNKGEGCVHWG